MVNDKSRAQIIATVGPASGELEVLKGFVANGMDVARLNFSWGTLSEHAKYIDMIRTASQEAGVRTPIIQDIPGPRLQDGDNHTLDSKQDVITDRDRECLAFGQKQGVDYVAVSYVRNADDLQAAREHISNTPVIAKIERKEALHNFNEILSAADAIMIARGDLGDQIQTELIPFVQKETAHRANKAGVPVIVATEMLLSMVDADRPSRAEVTDIAFAILHGADAVMLSEETASGSYPIEAVAAMERVAKTAEGFQSGTFDFHNL